MFLPQADVELLTPFLIQLAKIAVLVAVRVVLLVFVPQQLQGDGFLFHLLEQVFHGWHARLVNCGRDTVA